MKREKAFEGQYVYVKDQTGTAKEFDGKTGVIVQLWSSLKYKWHDWALVEFANDIEYILFEDLEPIPRNVGSR